MKVIEFYKRKKRPIYSLEIFPPRDGTTQRASDTVNVLKKFEPAFVSVTCWVPEPLTRSILIAQEIKKRFGIETLVHLTCLSRSEEEIKKILADLKEAGITNILALRGDIPKDLKMDKGPYQHASELVERIKSSGDFCVSVAGYPEGHLEAPSLKKDLEYLKMKIDKGADFVITQMFFNTRYYLEFVARARKIGIKVPIIPGVMPMEAYFQIKSFLEEIRPDVPCRLKRKLEEHKEDKDYIRKIGREFTLSMCRELISKGAPGIHFYTLNNPNRIARILEELPK